MLSSMDPHEIQKSILGENLEAIKSIKGIGLKTAQRVLIELKDKVQKIEGFDENLQSKSNTIKEETLSALEVLGYSRRQTEKVIDNIIQSHPEGSIEELIKSALNKL
jgi:Holliday junction DNA helicase RuvA